MKRSTIALAVVLLLGNLVVVEWIAWQAFSGALSPQVDVDDLAELRD